VINVYLLKYLNEIQDFTEYPLSLLFFSRKDSAEGNELMKNIRNVATRYFPKLMIGYVDLDRIPVAAGKFAVFTSPALRLYSGCKHLTSFDGQMTSRDVTAIIQRYYQMVFAPRPRQPEEDED
jgi:thioredoxin-like negative regulator of GroEL